MCLVGLAWAAHVEYPLILVANRDEYHARASAAAAWWGDAPEVFGGRDLVAGGSWLACSRTGRIAVVINDPRRRPNARHDRSRGDLVRDFVTGTAEAASFLESLGRSEHRYAGFQLLVGTARGGFMGFRSPAGSGGTRIAVPPGVSAWSNSPPEAPWPKVQILEEALQALVSRSSVQTEDLLAPLQRGATADTAADEMAIRAVPFVRGRDYGTRASTVLLVDATGVLTFRELRYAPGGAVSGETEMSFPLAT